MFYGESSHSLDPKGRLFVPKRFQDELSQASSGARVAIVTRGQDSCLYLFSESGFEVVRAELQREVFSEDPVRATKRLFFAHTARVELDASGRMLIPEKLRASVEMKKDVVIVGVGDRAEIWPQETWERYQAQHIDKLDHIDHYFSREGRGKGG